MPKIYPLKEEERLPQEFWEDQKWTLEHYSELRVEYADMWVAVINKKVVAYGKDLTDEKEESLRKSERRPPVILFVESKARILYE